MAIATALSVYLGAFNVTTPTILPTSNQFLRPAILGDDLDLDGTGARTKEYTDAATIDADEALSQISAAVSTAAKIALTNGASRVLVINRDVAVGSETVAAALNAGFDESAFGYVCYTNRTAADQVAMAAWAETRVDVMALCASADSDWLTSGVPAAFSSATTYKQSGVIYLDDGGEYWDAAAIGRASSFSPDVRRHAWRLRVQGETAYDITTSQEAFALANNANFIFRDSANASTYQFGPGQAFDGSDLAITLTRAWLYVRGREAIAQGIADDVDAGGFVSADATGEIVAQSWIEPVFALGAQSRHILAESTTIAGGYDITTSSDATAGTITINATAVVPVPLSPDGLTVNVSLTVEA